MSTVDFQEIVNQHYEKLFRFALGLSRSPDDAADLTQQTFFIWATKGHQLRDKAKAKSWLFTTLHREFLKQIQRGKRMQPLKLEDYQRETPTVEHGGDRKIDFAMLLDVIQGLDEAYRVPLMFFYTEEFSYKEIAASLEIPIGTVMTRLSRGREQIRKALEKRPVSETGKIVDFEEETRKRAGNG
ncbi:MAG: RNA polymerase sigma factor [Verrucomicrobiales bacterium]